MNNWIMWSGMSVPDFKPETRIDVFYRDGEVFQDVSFCDLYDYQWNHNTSISASKDSEIIFFRHRDKSNTPAADINDTVKYAEVCGMIESAQAVMDNIGFISDDKLEKRLIKCAKALSKALSRAHKILDEVPITVYI